MYLAMVVILLVLGTVDRSRQQQSRDHVLMAGLAATDPQAGRHTDSRAGRRTDPRAGRRTDLVFLLDGSSSIGRSDFGVQLFFVESLLTDLSIGPDETRVAVVSYGETATRYIDQIAGEPGNKCSFLNELKAVTYNGGGTTNIARALEEAGQILAHSRPNVTQTVVLLSDGVSNTGADPVAEADTLRASGLEIFTIGVGLFDRTQLQRMAGSTERFFSYNSFDNFRRLALRMRGDPRETMYDDTVDQSMCDSLCVQPFPGADKGCCDLQARCTCSLVGGLHQCVCGPGTYGLNGFLFECKLCPRGTYKDTYEPSDRCTPCPLEATTAAKGSTSLRACYCKEGFEGNPSGGEACRVTTCGLLTSPDHGRVLPRDCSNKHQSVCSFECESGYELVGSDSAKRRCKANGLWTGTVAQCRKVRCPVSLKPANGMANCQNQESGGGHAYGTVCRFSCDAGYNPVGSRERTCSEMGHWSGEEFGCRAITCPALPGNVLSTCDPGVRQPAKTRCDFWCEKGFALQGPEFKLCQIGGRWTRANQEVACVDVTPPRIKCPPFLRRDVDPGQASALVAWDLPSVSDNDPGSTAADLVLSTEPPGLSPPHTFPIGAWVVSYNVTDRTGLSSGCAFKVQIEDTQPPTVESCPGPVLDITSSRMETPATWDEPTFADNSGQELTIVKSHSPGDALSWGTHVVTYRATDVGGQSALCRFTLRIGPSSCPNHPEPRNGARLCDKWVMGEFCRVYCNEAYEFAETPADWYICSGDQWTTMPVNSHVPWPDCSEKFPANGMRRPGMETRYYAGDCTNPKTVNQIKQAFINDIGGSFIDQIDACQQENTCTVDTVAVYCGEIDGVDRRRRRRRRRGAEGQAAGLRSLGGPGNIATVVFTLSTKIRSPDEDLTRRRSQLANAAQTLGQISQDLERRAQTGQLRLVVGNQTLDVVEGSFAATASQPIPLCRTGSMVLDDTECLSCPVGSYGDMESEACMPCPAGTYQDEEGQDRCKPCPDGEMTDGNQAKNISDCRAECQPGTFSSSGLATCRPCQRGSYQPRAVQTACLPCPAATTTPASGSKTRDDCQAVCQPGTYSVTGLHPCQPCPLASYQPDTQQRRCLPCQGSTTTAVTGAQSGDQCQEINACESHPCRNRARCTSERGVFHCHCTGGFAGPTCEEEIDECRYRPCLFNATCIDQVDGFYCACAPGFEGALCGVEVDECSSNPCQNGGQCRDQTAGFECDCVDGYRGSRCELAPDPCAGGAACLNCALCRPGSVPGAYSCVCPPGFHGVRCQTDLDECDAQPCQNGGSCANTPGSYHCACALGYEGPHCERNVDDCLRHACAAGSTCRDVIADYQCVCPPGVTGRYCETEICPEFLLNFNSSLTSDLSLLRTGHVDLNDVTLSMWLRPSPSANMATPISYAAYRQSNSASGEGALDLVDNALTVSDLDSLKVYVNGRPALTDAMVPSGSWSSLVFTWSALDGEWRLYLNGSRAADGSGLSGEAIPGGGAFVLGQEQDSLGGSFSSREAYLGDVYKLNVWDRLLSEDEIQAESRNCGSNRGNVIAWPDFLAGLDGRLVPTPRGASWAEVPDYWCDF